ncbi:hypothetical protein K8I31_22565 [bacterium]|nr:hypothetical protein [bacterium]
MKTLQRNFNLFISRLSIWIAIASISIQLPVHSMVLCLGGDGHVSVEYSIQGACTDATDFHDTSEHTAIATTAPSPEHCGDCYDIAIPSQNIKNVRLARLETSTGDSLSAVLHDAFIQYVGVSPNPAQTFTHSIQSLSLPTLQSLHTVVLVI